MKGFTGNAHMTPVYPENGQASHRYGGCKKVGLVGHWLS